MVAVFRLLRSWSATSLRGHLALALVREEPRSVIEREPARLGHLVAELVRDVAEPSRGVADEIEADDLEDALALPDVDVADIAELLDEATANSRFLGHLA
jgi:hypothetical protein